ncbi:hypothetical protein V8G54_020505 [Vigna mungo]|uniref:Uncharacterized protein n=1 Tax=Vigna mungo TaxID=3915 RepID=A0AAQ3RWG6_VIGMU
MPVPTFQGVISKTSIQFPPLMKNFNNKAYLRTLLFAFDCKCNAALSALLSNFMCNVYNDYASSLISKDFLPYFADRVGFRSKLISFDLRMLLTSYVRGNLLANVLLCLMHWNRWSPPLCIMHSSRISFLFVF